MEGMFAFFLERAFVGALIWGEKRLGPRGHFGAAIAVAVGSWISGYFHFGHQRVMQNPVGYQIETERLVRYRQHEHVSFKSVGVRSVRHNQLAALVTGSFVVPRSSVLRLARSSSSSGETLFAGGTLVG